MSLTNNGVTLERKGLRSRVRKARNFCRAFWRWNYLTQYDRTHLATYIKLLDAETIGADWKITAAIVLGLKVDGDEKTARATYEAHVSRARWMTTTGYRQLLS